jgi:predicted metalloprotease with PDZ domain
VARVRAGWITEEEFWRDLMTGMPKGLLQPGEEGLNDSHRWGPLYWGGALFWFLADLEIRERTGNRRGLEDALRGIQQAGGSMGVSWTLERLLAEGDRSIGHPVLKGLYDRMGRGRETVDLDALWTRLGVERAEQTLHFRDDAPLAAIRRAITSESGKEKEVGAR